MSRKYRGDDGRFRRMRSKPRRCDYGRCSAEPLTAPDSWSAWEKRNRPRYCLEHLETVRANARLVERTRRLREIHGSIEVTPYGEVVPGP